jgi:hypothetical protein
MPPENSQSSQITDKTAVPSVHTDQTVDEQLDYFIEASPLPGASFAALELVESRASRNGLEKIQSNHMERVSSGKPPSGKDLEKLDTNDGAENTELDEGWRNRGWQVVIASFLVNFCVFGITFSWGILQD